jgi:hypothetical protein
MPHSRLSRVLRAAGAAFVPVIALALAPGSAAAECGSYVTILDGHGRTQTPADPGHPMPKAPCHGPNCHGAPKAPAPVPPAPTGSAPDAKAVATSAAAGPGDPFAGQHPSDPDGSAVRRPNLIFHPPRAS